VSLSEVRAEIDRLDDQIVALLALRQEQVRRAAAFKKDAAEVAAPDRRARMMVRLRERATAEGVAPELVDRVWTTMIDAFIELELREHESQVGGPPGASGSRPVP